MSYNSSRVFVGTAMFRGRASSLVQGGRILVYPEAGHFMFVEQPERFARDVIAFLRER